MEAWQMVLAVAGAIAILAGGASGLYVLIVRPGRKIKQIADRAEEFLGDWFGVEERPGVPGRPGVMVRLATIEGELHPNGGGSLRDVVNGTAGGMRRLEDAFAAHLADHRAEARLARQFVITQHTSVGGDAQEEGEGDGGDRPGL
ncbi:hypothetical protein AB0C10_15715 [Microbispora amethystogenes]|uniref:hypothetical protein n=1 Tax=Microbispora amethystogenes TaxID=1427754 RepID=UPI003402A8B1